MSDPAEAHRSPLARAWEIARFAPVGLVMEAPALLPKLADQGREHVRNARVVGELAVRQGRAQARQHLDGVDGPARDVLRRLGVLGDDGDGASPDPTEERRSDPAHRTERDGRAPTGTEEPTAEGAVAAPDVPDSDRAPAPTAADLAIEDYESLSAPQVVARLPGLTPDELEAVRAFEAAHRGRKTILNKAAQLR